MLVWWKALLVLFPIRSNKSQYPDHRQSIKETQSLKNHNNSLNKICHSTTNQNKFWIPRMQSSWSKGVPGLTTLVKADRASLWEILFCQILLLLFFSPLLTWLTHLRALCWIANINIYIPIYQSAWDYDWAVDLKNNCQWYNEPKSWVLLPK